MGPWPVVYLLDLVRRGDDEKSRGVIGGVIGSGNMKKGSSSGTVVVEQTIKSGKEKTPCFTLE